MRPTADLPTELLPKVLQDFVRLIGLAATMKIVEAHGGRRLYIPVNPARITPIAELIGLEKLAILSQVYGLQDHFDIPKAVRAMRYLRDEHIRAEYGPKSISTLSSEYGLVERQIFNIVARPSDNYFDQPSLFG